MAQKYCLKCKDPVGPDDVMECGAFCENTFPVCADCRSRILQGFWARLCNECGGGLKSKKTGKSRRRNRLPREDEGGPWGENSTRAREGDLGATYRDTNRFVGLTEKAIRLEQGTHAAFKELVTEASPQGIRLEKGVMEALKRRFDALWKRAGLTGEKTPLLDGILTELRDGPKFTEQLFSLMRDDTEFDDFRDLEVEDFDKAVQRLLDAKVITENQEDMWTIGPLEG